MNRALLYSQVSIYLNNKNVLEYAQSGPKSMIHHIEGLSSNLYVMLKFLKLYSLKLKSTFNLNSATASKLLRAKGSRS